MVRLFDRWEVSISYMPKETSHNLAKKLLPLEHALHVGVVKDFYEGNIQELPRRERLVQEHEIPILEEAKRIAKILYPRG